MLRDDPRLSSSHDFFDERLKEINCEMQGILDRTKQRRSEIAFMPARTVPLPSLVSEAAVSRAAAPVAADSLPSDSLEKTIARVCQTEVTKWMEANLHNFLEPLIQSHTQKEVEAIQRGLQELRFSHRETLTIVQEVKSQIDEQRSHLTSAVHRIERQANTTKQYLQEEMDSRSTKLRDSISSLQDAVADVKRKLLEEQHRGERRIEEAVQRQQELVRCTLQQLEDQVYQGRDELSARVRQYVDQIRGAQSSLEHHVSQLQGVLDSAIDASNRQAADVRLLLEEGVERRSEARLCRRDVNRLEMLLQCFCGSAPGVPPPSLPLRTGPHSPPQCRHTGEGVHRSSVLLMNELVDVKEKLSFLSSRVGAVEDGLDRGMEGTLLPPRTAPPPGVQESEKLQRSATSFGQLSAGGNDNNTSVTATAPADSSVTAPGAPLSRQGNTQLSGVDNSGFGSASVRRPTSDRIGLHATITTPIAANRLPYESSFTDGRPFRSHGSLLDLKESVDRVGNSSRGSPLPTQPNNTSSVMPSTVVGPSVHPGGTPGNSLRQKLSEAATPHSLDDERKDEPEDSYVSVNPSASKSQQLTGDPTVSSGKTNTYAPPPTSDSESDRDNQHLTRLAID